MHESLGSLLARWTPRREQSDPDINCSVTLASTMRPTSPSAFEAANVLNYFASFLLGIAEQIVP